MTISGRVQALKTSFQKGVNRSYESRMKHLRLLKKMISDNEKELCEAINRDFGKPYFEAFTTEIYTVLNEIDLHLKNLSSWMKPESASGIIVNFPSKNVVRHQPYGTVLVIGAWNYPVYLALMPVVGAISGGNTVLLKPSELSPNTSGILRSLVEAYFEDNIFTVVEGGVRETTELLNQPFNKIFFTGSSRVGKIVMKAAAEQLIPVTLELGGKSPAIIHRDVDISVATKRLWWGKTINGGQTCVAPDFAPVHVSVKDQFISESKKALSSFFCDDFVPGTNFTRIVNDHHFERLTNLLDGSEVLHGGKSNPDSRFIEPTLISADWDDEIMEDEIFGPLLPMVTYEDADELIEKLLSMPEPLALYLFTNNRDFQKRIFDEVPFGGGCVNDTITHLANPSLPYGGVGSSGMGEYHGKFSFETFTRPQGIMKKGTWPDPELRYPPYDETRLEWFKRLLT